MSDKTTPRSGDHQDGSASETAAGMLARWTSTLDRDAIPQDVLQAAGEHLLDTLGCGLAAADLGQAGAGAEVAGATEGPATILGRRTGAPAVEAALANGMLCHALDFDDTHESSICHIGTVVGPTALALAESVGASGADLLVAVVAGVEVTARLGMAAPNGFHRRGFHPTGVCGAFGATVTAARLLGLGAHDTRQALGLAGSMASGIFEYLADGSQTKPLHAGWAAQAGIRAAQLAAAGAEGPATVLEGRFGLYATHVDEAVDVNGQLGDLGDRWETPRVAYKPYPACHWTHAAVDAAVDALGDDEISSVERVLVRIPASGVPIVLEPLEQRRKPLTGYDAKFSLPWCIAARLVSGRLDVQSFRDEALLGDPRILDLAARVHAEPWVGPEHSPFAGAATVMFRDGGARDARREYPRGAPGGEPFGADAVRAKFIANATPILGTTQADAVADAALGLSDASNPRALTQALRAL